MTPVSAIGETPLASGNATPLESCVDEHTRRAFSSLPCREACALLLRSAMHVVPTPDPNDPAQPVINAVVAHVLRWGRAPRVLLAVSEGESGEIGGPLIAELRRRELDVVVATHARAMHAGLRTHFA